MKFTVFVGLYNFPLLFRFHKVLALYPLVNFLTSGFVSKKKLMNYHILSLSAAVTVSFIQFWQLTHARTTLSCLFKLVIQYNGRYKRALMGSGYF